jgi:hypothetical protein
MCVYIYIYIYIYISMEIDTVYVILKLKHAMILLNYIYIYIYLTQLGGFLSDHHPFTLDIHQQPFSASLLTNQPLLISAASTFFSTKTMKVDIQVISTDTIKPSSSTPDHLRHHTLSFTDQIAPPFFMPFLLFYPRDSVAHLDHQRRTARPD